MKEIDFVTAKKLFSDYLQTLEIQVGEPLAVLDENTIEGKFGWVFFYNSVEFIESGRFSSRLTGNAPIIVDREDGSIHVTGTAFPIEHYIDEFVSGKNQCVQIEESKSRAP
jgi:hypothetical protein